jgi:hypothetical protein
MLYRSPASFSSKVVRLRATILWLCLSSSALAAPISQSYLCTQGHEQDATAKLQNVIKEAVLDFFKKRKIPINAESLQVNLSASTQTGMDSVPYIQFKGGATGGSVPAALSNAATVSAQGGTKFHVLLSSGSDNQDAAEYRIISAQQGFDKEGNAIHQHCTLALFNAGDMEATKELLIINAVSGHALGSIHLPSRIVLY